MTSDINIRPIEVGDVEWVAAALGQWELARNTSKIPHPLSKEFCNQWVQSWVDDAEQNSAQRIVGFTREYEGFGSAAYRKTFDKEAEISFWITPKFWRKGFATIMVADLIKEAHLQNFDRLTAGHFADNCGSAAVLRKFGFMREPQTEFVHSVSRAQTVETVRYFLSIPTNA